MLELKPHAVTGLRRFESDLWHCTKHLHQILYDFHCPFYEDIEQSQRNLIVVYVNTLGYEPEEGMSDLAQPCGFRKKT